MYTYPSVAINFVTYTARRFAQSPTITYDTSDDSVTAGNEIVEVAANLSDITIYIEDGASTNQNIADAINSWDGTTDSLYPRDLVSVSIQSGKEAEVNSDEGPDAMTGGSNVPPFSEPANLGIVPKVAVDPVRPSEGDVWYNTTSHLLKFYDGTDVQVVATV
jgi:hypothetical protein